MISKNMIYFIITIMSISTKEEINKPKFDLNLSVTILGKEYDIKTTVILDLSLSPRYRSS